MSETKMLNKIGPSLNPCDIPAEIGLRLDWLETLSFILTKYCLFDKIRWSIYIEYIEYIYIY